VSELMQNQAPDKWAASESASWHCCVIGRSHRTDKSQISAEPDLRRLHAATNVTVNPLVLNLRSRKWLGCMQKC